MNKFIVVGELADSLLVELEVLPSMTIRRYNYFSEGVSFLTLDVLNRK
jgi:hypothetical protein